jgi:hypothetical protein
MRQTHYKKIAFTVVCLMFLGYNTGWAQAPFLEQVWLKSSYTWNTSSKCRDMDYYNGYLYVIDHASTSTTVRVINASTGNEDTSKNISNSRFTGFSICSDNNGSFLVTEGSYGMTKTFKASKMVGTTVTYLSDTPSETGGRIDYLDMYGNFNNGSGYIVGATTNTGDQISVWTFSNGTISNIANPIAFRNLRGSAYINSDICIVDNLSFWVSGAGIKPILVTMNSDKSYSGKTTLNLPSNPPCGGIAYFELRSKKYVVVPTNTDGTVTVYNVDNMNAPVEIASTVSLNVSGLTHTPIEVVTGEDNALIYIWGVNGGAAAYKFCLPPTVTANDATNVQTTTATLNASFVKGTKTITARGFRYGTSSGNYPSSCNGTVSGTNFSAGITGLTANTTYYYQAYVTTADGTVYSNEKNFTTSPIPPTVTTNDATNIQTTTATLNASFTQGSKPITARGFNYGTTSGSYTLSADGAVSGSTFSANITGLTANTTYYYKAYVTTDDGTVYGDEISFTTLAVPPTVTTEDATSVQTTTATLNASFTQGSKPITARGFNYGTTSGSYTLSADGAVSGSTFSANITGLTANTTYYYQAYVTTDDGTVYGNEKSFKTNLGAIVIAANESKPIANNYVGDIVIHHGGQISNDTAFSFTGQIRYKRTFNTPIVWHTCCFPFAIDHVTVEKDGVEYTIVPYYQGAPAHSCHFWIKTLDRDPSNPELYQRWTTPTTSTIKKDTAYIIIFPKITDSTSYYDNKVVTFYSTNGNHTINNTDMPVSTYEYTGNGFYFYANLSLRNQSFSGTEFYRLDRTPYTGNFELHENPIIVPSECFIQASDEFKQKSTSIFLPKSTEDSGVYTGLPPTLDTKTTPLLVINSINGIELLSHTAQTIAVYTTNGLKVATCTLSAGEIHTISLPKGIYIIVSDQSPLPLKVIN